MQQRREKMILFLQYIQESETVSRARGESHNDLSESRMTKSPFLSRLSYDVLCQEIEKLCSSSRYMI